MELARYKPYMANIVQELHLNDYAARVAFAESTLNKIKKLTRVCQASVNLRRFYFIWMAA